MSLKVFALGALAVLAAGGVLLSPQVQGAAPQAGASGPSAAAAASAPAAVQTVPGMPAVSDARNLYSDTNGAQYISAALKGDLARIYVPNLRSNEVSVIDPATLKVVDKFKVGLAPQHIVPSWDLRTLWVANNAERTNLGSLTPVDPATGKPSGKALPVDDPYNLYFTPDGKSAIVVAEAKHRLDFRDPKTMAMQYAIDVPKCPGINHADFSIDGRFAFFTCEFDGSVAKIDLSKRQVLAYLRLTMPSTRFKEAAPGPDGPASEICTATKGMPQDIRLSPDGRHLFVADMSADGLHVLDAESFKEIGFIATGVAAHGLYPSRDGKSLYVANRGSHSVHGKRKGPGSVTVVDFATEKVVRTWPIPGGGSPDMGNVSADGKWLWLSGRFDDVVYRIDTQTGAVTQIAVGQEPHGLTVWPQPGRYSLGHTGNLR
jgi:YVTN family beta-propeller protein